MNYWRKIRSNLPESAEKKVSRLTKQYGLNEKLAKQIADSEFNLLFDEIVKETGVQASTIAVFLTETLKALKREGVQMKKSAKNKSKASSKLSGQEN